MFLVFRLAPARLRQFITGSSSPPERQDQSHTRQSPTRMSIRKKLQPTFNSIQASNTATCDLYLGQSYLSAWLERSDDSAASNGNETGLNAPLDNLVGDIRVTINGKQHRLHTNSGPNDARSVNREKLVARTSCTASDPGYRVYLPIGPSQPEWGEPHDNAPGLKR